VPCRAGPEWGRRSRPVSFGSRSRLDRTRAEQKRGSDLFEARIVSRGSPHIAEGWSGGDHHRSSLLEVPNHLVTEFSYADVVERLFREFNGQHPLPVIVDVVRGCLTDLEGQVPPGALAELLERSARQRLTFTWCGQEVPAVVRDTWPGSKHGAG